jgi:Uma2 family endonuclease
LTRLFGDTVRGPDVAFVAWDRLPEGKLPRDPIPDLVPNLVIEVLSAGNTYLEMSRKRREYFHAGVQLLWMVDPEERSVAVYRSPQDVQVLHAGEVLAGDAVLPGWQVDIGALFSKLDSRFSG